MTAYLYNTIPIMFQEPYYAHRIHHFRDQLDILKRKRRILTWGRFTTVLAFVIVIGFVYTYSLLVAAILLIVMLIVFSRLAALDSRNSGAIHNIFRLVKLNENELNIGAGKFTELPGGIKFVQSTHDYASDLDIFGRASLYQYINRTESEQGQQTLATWLLNPAANDEIIQRQNAAKELANEVEWRQQIQAYGKDESITLKTEQKLNRWVQNENKFSGKMAWNLLRISYPIISIGSLFLYMYNFIHASLFYPLLFLFFILSKRVSKIISPEYNTITNIEREINVLKQSVKYIEDKGWQSTYLNKLRQQFLGTGIRASEALEEFHTILRRFDLRLNPFIFYPLNAFLLWDLQIVFQLESWRIKFGGKVIKWFSAFGESEAIHSIANIHFNHPEWVFPDLDFEHEGQFNATGLGHPLIHSKNRVYNSFSTMGTGQISLITGSNMAGKSTFLRSIGVNIVLAMMGSPVCATTMRMFPTRVLSSMRVVDNLEENTSTFYAELKKLKQIVIASDQKENVFLLLDEIFRGTNSVDRHTGSEALLRQLVKRKAIGILATHDLELTYLAYELPSQIRNFHFDVFVQKDELRFDYKLKEGVCQSMNATILMKRIGIEV